MQTYTSLGTVAADAAYLSRQNCEAVAAHGGTPRIYPKKNVAIASRGRRGRAWAEMLMAFVDDPQKWLEEYNIRQLNYVHYRWNVAVKWLTI